MAFMKANNLESQPSGSLVFNRGEEGETPGLVFFIDFNGAVSEPNLSRVKHMNYIHSFRMPVNGRMIYYFPTLLH